MNKTEYDEISDAYKDSKLLGFRRYIEEYTIFELLGDLKGQKVLDLACGEGIYTRKIKRAGAEMAHGVDLSAEMIQLAEKDERSNPLGCTYSVGDVIKLDTLDSFDQVLASYLLNYAVNEKELTAFAQAIYRNLKPGGVLVGFNNNPLDKTNSQTRFKKYNFTKTCPKGQVEGDPVTYTFFNPDGTEFQLDNYFLSPEKHIEIFKDVGFSSFKWVSPMLADAGLEAHERGYWDEFMEHQPVCGFVAVK
jgi:ubiquinone/menaquinone biosynthesis C-methylase UbiE